MEIIKVKDYKSLSAKACELMVNKIKSSEKIVLGLATGSTPEGLYQCLIEKYIQKEISFKNSTTFNLDEYVGLSIDNPNSYNFFMDEKLFNHVDIDSDKVHVPNGVADDLEQECRNYEQMIQDAGHIDIQLLGLGINGHIGFNEPGTSFTSRTHVVELDESTRNANAHFFASGGEVPAKAISMGIQSIMESKEVILLASGEKKADAVAMLINGEVSTDFPASILKNHKHAIIIADEAALSKV